MNNPITSIFSTSNSTSNSNDTSSSRLSTNSAKIREVLLSRNLYTEFDDYPLDENKRQRIVNSISGILSSVMPFSSINLKNSVLGRLVSTPTTPLSEIGLVMLSKQFARNFSSNAILYF